MGIGIDIWFSYFFFSLYNYVYLIFFLLICFIYFCFINFVGGEEGILYILNVEIFYY